MSQTTEGVIALYVSIKVDVAALKDWSPERIEAFFSGIAQVRAAEHGEFGGKGE